MLTNQSAMKPSSLATALVSTSTNITSSRPTCSASMKHSAEDPDAYPSKFDFWKTDVRVGNDWRTYAWTHLRLHSNGSYWLTANFTSSIYDNDAHFPSLRWYVRDSGGFELHFSFDNECILTRRQDSCQGTVVGYFEKLEDYWVDFVGGLTSRLLTRMDVTRRNGSGRLADSVGTVRTLGAVFAVVLSVIMWL